MSVIIVLILASLVVAVAFLIAFIWSVRSGQYEDTLTPSMRMLLDDATPKDTFQKTGDAAAALPVSTQTTGRPTIK